jgi:hypothetical protein
VGASYIVGLDFGQSMDYSALVVLERQKPVPGQDVPLGTPRPPYQYAVRHLHRWQLGTSYPVIVQETAALCERLPAAGWSQRDLVVDHTGCGRPVVDLMQQTKLHPTAVTLHGGDRVTRDGRNYRTPKRDLVGCVAVLLQQQRLQFAQDLPLTPILTKELLNFKVKIDPATAHDSYSAWREADHDDLVLALALACWWAEYSRGWRVGIWSLVV